jgi:hypothetical protein
VSCGRTGPRLRAVFSRDLVAVDLIEPTFVWAQFLESDRMLHICAYSGCTKPLQNERMTPVETIYFELSLSLFIPIEILNARP